MGKISESTISSSFGEQFEQKVVKLLATDEDFLKKVRAFLQKKHFESATSAFVANTILTHYQNYYKLPTKEELIVSATGFYFDDSQKALLRAANDLIEFCFGASDVEKDFIIDKIIPFVQRAELSRAIRAVANKWDSLCAEDIQTLQSDIQKINGIKSNATDPGVSSDEFFARILSRTDDDSGIMTGFLTLDAKIRGGFRPGELAVVLAPPNRGKTATLVNLGRGFLSCGYSVVHYSLEMYEDDMIDRYSASMCQIDMDALNDPKSLPALKAIAEYSVFTQKNVLIKHFPAETATIFDLESHLEGVIAATGDRPDVIIIDYADLIKPTRTHDQKRIEIGSIYKELRNFGKRIGAPIITASQTNKEGLMIDYNGGRAATSTPKALSMGHLSEDFSKAMTADYVFGLRQPYPYLKWSPLGDQYLLIMDIIKTRHSAPNSRVYFKCEFSKYYMEDITKEEIGVDDLQNELEARKTMLNTAEDEDFV